MKKRKRFRTTGADRSDRKSKYLLGMIPAKGICFGAGLLFLAGIILLAALSLGPLRRSGAGISQPPYRLISAQAVPDGIRVDVVGENLMLKKGVRVTADSLESKAFPAELVKDGIAGEGENRWSSVNDWENTEHWLQADFGGEVSVGCVRIYWERTNACSYTLEYSGDGKEWKTAAAFSEAPAEREQVILLEEPVQARGLRLHVLDVKKEEEDLSLYYQNVSVQELEVYGEICDSLLIRTPQPGAGTGRTLLVPSVPEPYSLRYAGADYGNLVDENGRLADTLSDVEIEMGFVLEREGIEWELPGMKMILPASVPGGVGEPEQGASAPARAEEPELGASVPASAGEPGVGASTPGGAEEPKLGASTPVSAGEPELGTSTPGGAGEPELEASTPGSPEAGSVAWSAAQPTEWKATGSWAPLSAKTQIIIEETQYEELEGTAHLFAEELTSELGRSVSVASNTGEVPITENNASGTSGESADARSEISLIRICLAPSSGQEDGMADYLGQEGYELQIREKEILLYANTAKGIRWGCVTLLDLLSSGNGVLPLGTARDYPRYEVRGFGIDVGRRPISMELLREIVKTLSRNKMNTLHIHLNDNQIISQSEYDGTLEGARSLYAGFRLESELKNSQGEGITSTDLYYTKEEFMELIDEAALYGVDIVPEIDTPAHSLALTKVFSELGMSKDPEGADMLDLSKAEARELGKALWKEYLTAPDGSETRAVFEDCAALHLGMDEYFGDAKDYYAYLKELSEYVSGMAPDKKLRIWGSLSMLEGDLSGISRDLQMYIWDTSWADPEEMYAEGFSIINALSSSLYLIPGGGYDRLDLTFLKEEWEPNIFQTAERTWEIPAWSDRCLGACYMMWNDWASENGHEITEEDLYERFAEPLPVIAEKLW